MSLLHYSPLLKNLREASRVRQVAPPDLLRPGGHRPPLPARGRGLQGHRLVLLGEAPLHAGLALRELALVHVHADLRSAQVR